MKLNKDAKKMLFGVAAAIKRDNPKWSDHTCIEEAFIKCAGMENYNTPIDYLVPEFKEYLKQPTMQTDKSNSTPVGKEEGEHTPGEWFVEGGLTIRTKDWHIANLNPYAPESSNSEANAELIVKAVNNYHSLLESNRELVEALKGVIRVADRKTDEFDKAKEAINKYSK